ncbi:MAG: 30S ribosomal protein S13, partial [Candidatus Asgardarchaeia archaeon]
HLLGSDLILRINMDIQREKKLRSWRGMRHALGLKVRGQKTRTTGRTGRTVGVRRKKK